MKFYVFDISPTETELDKYKKCIILIRDRWDDWFKYETQCNVYYVNDEVQKIFIGELKIGQFNMIKQRTA